MSSYYSITRCFYRRNRRDRRRHSKQQHVAWYNKRLRLLMVPLNRNNTACVTTEHSLLPAGLRLAICLKSGKKRRINYKIRSVVHEINSDVRLYNSIVQSLDWELYITVESEVTILMITNLQFILNEFVFN